MLSKASIFIVSVILATPVLAQSGEEAVAAEPQEAPGQPEKAQAPVAEVEQPVESPERFVPTEDISEDLSVSFPADI